MSEFDAAATGQIGATAAEIYDAFFLPALFDQWPPRVLDAARVASGDHVLDVGCGTGVLARAAARRLAGSGSVTGIDVNPAMLAVAHRATEPVVWRQGTAEQLPFPDRSFDRVISQFAVMFFGDRSGGVGEMVRVVRPGGTVAVATWATIDDSPGYAAMRELVRRLAGDEAAAAIDAPFAIGTVDALRDLLAPVLPDVHVERHAGVATFASMEAWVHIEIRGWTLADMLDDGQFRELLSAAERELAGFVDTDGRVRFSAPSIIASAIREA